MKISSQLANNFDYCSAEGLFKMISLYELLRDLSASVVQFSESLISSKRVSDSCSDNLKIQNNIGR